ncbi:MAG: arsenite methyltransferase [Eubacteriales bacterium]|nr:arsenite methyltransferase [Eubacteriales bacterium]
MARIQEEIKKRYGRIARRVSGKRSGGCGCGAGGCCPTPPAEANGYRASELADLPEDAIRASLGCSNPVALANLQPGETVLDLGSGGGIDVLLSARLVGETGRAYGLDMTDDMLRLANRNLKKSGLTNVTFLKGYIESIPLENETVDVVTSNCVINLTEDKFVALSETYRVLKKGGRLAIADIVQLKPVPDSVKKSIELWVGCVSGALTLEAYEDTLRRAGFTQIEIQPVGVYEKSLIEEIAHDKKLQGLYSEQDADLLDGAFASAHVKAKK